MRDYREKTSDRPLAAAGLSGACAVFGLVGLVLRPAPSAYIAFGIAYVAGMALPLRTSLGLLRRRQLGVDLLMVLAAAGAAILDDWWEGVVLLFLFNFSGTLEAYAMYRTTRSIDALVRLRPRDAVRVIDGCETRVPIVELGIGDVVRVRPGERYAIDGEVIDGETWADEATITGESTPVKKSVGAMVFAGTINNSGSVLVRMTRATADTTLERIVQMVQVAQTRKTPAQKTIEAWQPPYVAGVLVAVPLAFLGSWWFHDRDLADAFYHAMVLLVAVSPCAVIASSPSAVLSAIARAARYGVLFKGGACLQTLGNVDVVAFDKTGTITFGKPSITTIWCQDGIGMNELLRLAAAVERRSEHPLAQTVTAEANHRGLEIPDVSDFESHSGLGVHARADGLWIGVGREGLFTNHGVLVPSDVRSSAEQLRNEGQTALLVIADKGPSGVIAVSDQVRPDVHDAIAALKASGIRSIVILTGDHARVAQAVARQVGADDVRAQLLPDEKVIELRRLMDRGSEVAMVGDGVNDAPSLAVADVGIAMGGAGTDVALEAADVVLIRDDLTALPFAVWLSRKAQQRVNQNLTISLGVIGLLVLSSFFGLPLWLGVVAHEGSTLVVVGNGLRLFWDRFPASNDRLSREKLRIPAEVASGEKKWQVQR